VNHHNFSGGWAVANRRHLHDGRSVGGWAVAAVAAVARQRMEAATEGFSEGFSWGFDQPR